MPKMSHMFLPFSRQGTPRGSKPKRRSLPPTRSAQQKREKLQQQKQKRQEANKSKETQATDESASPVTSDSERDPRPQTSRKPPSTVLCGYVKIPTSRRIIKISDKQPPKRKKREDRLEEAVAERLRLEAEAEAEAAAWDTEVPAPKRPRLAARQHALRRIVGLLTKEDEPLPPRPGDSDTELDPGAESGAEPGAESEVDPLADPEVDPAAELGMELISLPEPEQEIDEPDQELEDDPDQEMEDDHAEEQELEEEPDQEMEDESDREPKQELEDDPEQELGENPGRERLEESRGRQEDGSEGGLRAKDTAAFVNNRPGGESESTRRSIAESRKPTLMGKVTLGSVKANSAAGAKTVTVLNDLRRTVSVAREAKLMGSARTVTIAEQGEGPGAEAGTPEAEAGAPGAEEGDVRPTVDVDAIRESDASDAEGVLAASLNPALSKCE